MHDVYVNLFNLVFDIGIIPEAWSVGKIIPIYNQKGDKSDPSNYRPITLLSCMGKLFTSVKNNRLQSFAEKIQKKLVNVKLDLEKAFQLQIIYLLYIPWFIYYNAVRKSCFVDL